MNANCASGLQKHVCLSVGPQTITLPLRKGERERESEVGGSLRFLILSRRRLDPLKCTGVCEDRAEGLFRALDASGS